MNFSITNCSMISNAKIDVDERLVIETVSNKKYVNSDIFYTDYKSDNKENEYSNPIRTEELLSWSYQVALGMEYISQKKV